MDQWNPAKVWQGDERQKCAYCREKIKVGEWSKQNVTTGHILHDDEAEDLGAYGRDFAVGGKYGSKV